MPATQFSAIGLSGGEEMHIEAGPMSEDAFSVVVAAHHRHLAGFAYTLCGDRDLAEDLVAEAYARVWLNIRKRRVEDLYPYLRRAVLNLARDRWRRRRIEQREEDRRQGARFHAPRGFAEEIDERIPLFAALMRLPLDQRAVIVLRHVEDLSEAETASALGIRPGTVKSRLGRGLAALRHLVEEDAP